MINILVIEDDLTVRENLVELLQAEGYACLEAENGEEGINVPGRARPDLILCDILMPRLDGFGVWATLSRDPETATIPFIYLTAKIEQVDQRRGMDLGADDYITKPFTREELLRAIRTRLDKHQVLIQQAETKLRNMRTNLSDSLPHELLSPLSVILSYTEVLAENPPSTGSSQTIAIVRVIQRAAQNLLDSLQNYLLLTELGHARPDPGLAGGMKPTGSISADITIREIAEMKAIQESRLSDLVLDTDEIWLHIPDVYLEKIVEELLDNAFRYSAVGSPVQLQLHMGGGGETAWLRIDDHGCGISAERLLEITTNREMIQNAFAIRGVPPGLGLLLVRRIVELHGGDLQIDSVVDQGTSISVSLPAALPLSEITS